MNKQELFQAGVEHITDWCTVNNVTTPEVVECDDPVKYGTCAYYRSGVIYIHVPSCAAIGRAGMAWSYPGYTVDRTPYGVLAHELGHHVDLAHGRAGGTFGRSWMVDTGERSVSNYSPDDPNEWFGEMFRLFVTNPSLLLTLRPRTHERMMAHWKPVESHDWEYILAGSERHLKAVRNKIKELKR